MSADQLPEWNRTKADDPRGSTIAEAFKQQAALTPNAIAVVAGERRLSYREFDEHSNRLANHLQFLGVGPETLVGIFLGRTEHLIIGILAILKAGGAYVPLEPAHPSARLSLVIKDSEMKILLTSHEIRDRLPMDLGPLRVLDVDDAAIAETSSRAISPSSSGMNLAYVMYTSGSTGKPKGVMVEHRNVINFFTGMDSVIGLDRGVWLAVTSAAFDISVLELLWTLTRGFTVVLHGDEGAATMGDEISRHGVTHLQMTPSLAQMLTLDDSVFSKLAMLKHILLGGETLPASLIRRLRQVFDGAIHNMYGPTETTIWSTSYSVRELSVTVPIGLPIANTQVYLLDQDFQPVAPGEAGEIFIGGDGVARGYWNQPQLTAERFVAIPALSADRVYRTGDLARVLADGNLEFLGRVDYQIKVRGHRIEPGEIEAALEQCTGIRQAVIVAREDREGDKRLVAYLVADVEGRDAANALRHALSTKLPEAMVPSAFVFLPALPLTGNGKIDREALLKLPPPAITITSTVSGSVSRHANEMERVVAQAWQEALGVSEIGLTDNFFDLGAHSLTVAEVQVKLQHALGREISLVDLFQFPTVSSLARHLPGTEQVVIATDISERAQRRRLARGR